MDKRVDRYLSRDSQWLTNAAVGAAKRPVRADRFELMRQTTGTAHRVPCPGARSQDRRVPPALPAFVVSRVLLELAMPVNLLAGVFKFVPEPLPLLEASRQKPHTGEADLS